MVTHALERIDIKEPLPVERNSGQNAVVQRALVDVGITSIAVEQGEPVVPLGQRDRAARLLVGGEVGQVVVVGETLVRGAGPMPPVMYMFARSYSSRRGSAS